MTTTTTTAAAHPEVAAYLEAVRSHLGGLPAEDHELLDDLEAHLNDVASNGRGSLVYQLGDPAAFAAELMASAGLTAEGADGLDTGSDSAAPARPERRSLRSRLEASPSWQAVRDSPAGQEVLAFLPELRPGWWVLRAYLAVIVLSVGVLSAGSDAAVDAFPLPSVAGSTIVGLILVGAACVVSVRWGRRSGDDERRRRLTVVANVLLIVLSLQALNALRFDRRQEFVPVDDHRAGQLTGTGGQIITNVYPYDREGRLLTGVTLHDQDARPIITGSSADGIQSFPIGLSPPAPPFASTTTAPPPEAPPDPDAPPPPEAQPGPDAPPPDPDAPPPTG